VITVAFSLIGGTNWFGGLNYQINLLNALLEYEGKSVRPILFLGKDAPKDCIDRFQGIQGLQVVHSSIFNKNAAKRRLVQSLVWGRDSAAQRLFDEYRVDIVFESADFYGWRFPFKTIAWIPDLQHKKLRKYFSHFAFWKREIGFRFQIWGGRHIMVSSEDACQDFIEFYKVRSNRMHVVRFSVPVKCEPFDRAALLGKYGLPENFFYLPNQFWRHKNHDSVIQALALAKQKGSIITVAVSGNPHDPRDPEHFQNLIKLSERLGVRNNFKVLGMIPYSDVQGLMQSCNALINPSCFEGWSTTAEEAKALGIRMLLSNLNVHQEQAGNRAEYFETDSPEELARLLSEYVSNPPRRFSNKQHEIVETSELQMARYADEFASMLKSVIEE
jgi:glycosyltransferase involved in cell wall biosynthesis